MSTTNMPHGQTSEAIKSQLHGDSRESQVVDTAMESSHLKHRNCISSSIYIYVHETCKHKKKEKREREIPSTILLPHIQPVLVCWGHAKKGRM